MVEKSPIRGLVVRVKLISSYTSLTNLDSRGRKHTIRGLVVHVKLLS